MRNQFLQDLISAGNYHIVLADGDFPNLKIFLSLLKNAKTLVSCDGATKHLLKYKINPDIIIGDGDSLNQEIINKFKHKIIKVSEQNSNDLTKAINYLHSKNIDNIIILGATGKREDHTVANIALLVKYQQILKKVCMISQYGIFTVHNGESRVKCKIGQQISFFAINNKVIVSCLDLKWPLDKFNFANWYCGTLNQATKEELNIKTNSDIILYRSFEIKVSANLI